ncbi:MAG: DUF1127 domain-containing protein [Pseudomonadota bacterium]
MSVITENTLNVQRPHEGTFGRIANAVRRWLQEAHIRRKSYKQTVLELSWCDERDLADLGIARFDIRRLAKEAAELKVQEFRTS